MWSVFEETAKEGELVEKHVEKQKDYRYLL